MALSRLERSWSYNDEEVIPFFLDLIAYREVSNTIAEKFGVEHQSPQLIVLKDGKVVANSSHNSIQAAAVADFLVNQ